MDPDARRSVVAQLLDYAGSLPEVAADSLPPLPDGVPVERHDVIERIERGDFLLVVAGDYLDSRVVRLSQSMLGDHIVNEWELALVEMTVFATSLQAARALMERRVVGVRC